MESAEAGVLHLKAIGQFEELGIKDLFETVNNLWEVVGDLTEERSKVAEDLVSFNVVLHH